MLALNSKEESLLPKSVFHKYLIRLVLICAVEVYTYVLVEVEEYVGGFRVSDWG